MCVIALKFGEEWGGWYSMLQRVSHWCGLWQVIRMGWESFSKFTYFEVGLGSRFRFCHDCWCGEQLLKITFPILFEIATYWEAFVADMLVSSEEGQRIYSSNVVFFHALESENPPNEDGDRMRWGLKSKGDFDTQSFFGALRGSNSTTFLVL